MAEFIQRMYVGAISGGTVTLYRELESNGGGALPTHLDTCSVVMTFRSTSGLAEFFFTAATCGRVRMTLESLT